MDNIITDESGDIRSGYFYRFGVPFDEEVWKAAEPDFDETWIVARRSPTDREIRSRPGGEPWMWAKHVGPLEFEPDGDPETRHDCPVSPDHVTHSMYKAFEVDLSGGARVGDILPEFSGNVVLSAPFAEKLKNSGLSGFDLLPATITVNQAWGRDDGEGPPLFHLRFLGRECQRPRKVVGVPNVCPFCGAGPLICPECGYEVSLCPKCDNDTRILSSVHKGAGDKRLRMAAEPKAGEVLDGSRWDGSDFFGSSYVTRRTVDWLLAVHAAPFYAQPVRVCIDDMSDEQRKLLEQARQPVGS